VLEKFVEGATASRITGNMSGGRTLRTQQDQIADQMEQTLAGK
jgi:hypothetical protein